MVAMGTDTGHGTGNAPDEPDEPDSKRARND